MVVVEEVFAEAAGVADFMEAVADFTAEGDSPAVILDLAAAAHLAVAGFTVADLTEVAASMAAAGILDGVAGAGAAEVGEDEAGAGAAGAGDLDGAGLIGGMAGDIRMATTATIRGITRPHLLIRILPMDIQRIT